MRDHTNPKGGSPGLPKQAHDGQLSVPFCFAIHVQHQLPTLHMSFYARTSRHPTDASPEQTSVPLRAFTQREPHASRCYFLSTGKAISAMRLPLSYAPRTIPFLEPKLFRYELLPCQTKLPCKVRRLAPTPLTRTFQSVPAESPPTFHPQLLRFRHHQSRPERLEWFEGQSSGRRNRNHVNQHKPRHQCLPTCCT